MFKVLTKSELFGLLDEGVHNQIGYKGNELKAMQDLAVYSRLRQIRGSGIGEIGGGESRILGALSRDNVAYNIEKFSGEAGGPDEEFHIEGVTNVRASVGEFSSLLEPNSFDVLFSISVVEHVRNESLGAFLEDQVRLLKVGGQFLHAIDIYIEDSPGAHYESRWELYRNWVTNDPRIEAVGEVDSGPIRFSTEMVSNPDKVMHGWGKLAPNLKELRLRAQCVSLLVHGRLIEK